MYLQRNKECYRGQTKDLPLGWLCSLVLKCFLFQGLPSAVILLVNNYVFKHYRKWINDKKGILSYDPSPTPLSPSFTILSDIYSLYTFFRKGIRSELKNQMSEKQNNWKTFQRDKVQETVQAYSYDQECINKDRTDRKEKAVYLRKFRDENKKVSFYIYILIWRLRFEAFSRQFCQNW